MTFYKMCLKSIPAIVLAHTYKTEHYRMELGGPGGATEISYIEQGDIERRYPDGRSMHFPAGSLVARLPGDSFFQESRAPLHQHATFAFHCGCTVTPISAEEVLQYHDLCISQEQTPRQPLEADTPFELILTDCILPGQQTAECLEGIRQIISQHNMSGSRMNRLACAGLVLSFLYRFSAACVRSALPSEDAAPKPSSLLYTQKAMQYVARHIDEKIFIRQVAESLSISTGYLSTVFKEVTGRTLVDYIHYVKMNKVKELILSRPVSLKQAGAIVGIEDEHYLCRLFKKQFGMSAREYKNTYGSRVLTEADLR